MILDRYLLRQLVPVFFMASGMFVILILLIDLFSSLPRYLTGGAPTGEILMVSVYYLPRAFAYSIPISLLFASAHTLGELYSRNELVSVFSRVFPFTVSAFRFSAWGFWRRFFLFSLKTAW